LTRAVGRLPAIDALRGVALLGSPLLSLILGALGLHSHATPAAAQSSAEAPSDRLRIERLADAGQLWGLIKFAHPALAYRDIDWDQSLIRALPAIRAARTAEDYAAAINSMLAPLNDPFTRAAVAPPPDPTSSKDPGPPIIPALPVRTVDGVLVMDVHGFAGLDAAGEKAAVAALTAADSKLNAEAAKAIVLDLRIPQGSDDFKMFFVGTSLRFLVGRILNRSLALGTSRSRQHYGYPAHDGMQSGGYASRLITRAPGVIVGQSKAASTPPIVILVNELALLAFPDVVVGLKAAGLARVVEETSGEHGKLYANVTLVGNVEVQMARSEVVGPDGQPDPGADLRVAGDAKNDRALEAAVRLALSPPPRTGPVTPPPLALQTGLDKAYPEMALPDADHRLLALFRLWSVARYFFPYLDLMDRPWADALVEFLPRFEAADTVLAYQTAVTEMAARLQDTHVGVSNATALQEHLGLFAPSLLVSQVEGQAVVRHVHDAGAAGSIQVGDVILAVDGVGIADRRKSLEHLIAASTPQAMSLLLDRMQLRGPKGSTARLRVRDNTGHERDVAVVRSRPHNDGAWLPALRTMPAPYGVLPSGFGYIDLQRLAYADADAALDAVMGAPGLVLDMRGYPNGTAWALAPRLVKAPPSRPIVGARFKPPFWDATSMPADPRAPSDFQLTFDQTLPETTKPRYQGKVVMLIDAWAISQAEHSCLFVAAATDVTFIGTPTNGANGDVTTMVLPGNLVVRFTGQEVRFPDGRQLQRLGVQPHVVAQPSIAGVRAGRDEVLEAAIEHLRKLKL
jgi:C-terminal processing protease CtpA/Prc